MSLSTFALSEVQERTIDFEWEKYYNCGGVNFSRKFHPDFVGAWSEHRIFLAMDWVILADITTAPEMPATQGFFSFGLQHGQTASFNTAGTCPLLFGVTGFDTANTMTTGFSTGGIPYCNTTLRYHKIENGVRTAGPNTIPTHYISLQSVHRTLVALRYQYDGVDYDLTVLAPTTADGVERDVSQADMVDLYNTPDWADIVTAMTPYGYGVSMAAAGVTLDTVSWGELDAVHFSFNQRYFACELTALIGKVIA